MNNFYGGSDGSGTIKTGSDGSSGIQNGAEEDGSGGLSMPVEETGTDIRMSGVEGLGISYGTEMDGTGIRTDDDGSG